MSRTAVCLYGELRGIKSCIPSLYENIIDLWDSDVFLCFNLYKKSEYDEINQIYKKVIISNIYEKEDVYTRFPKTFYEKYVPYMQQVLKQSNKWGCNIIGPILGSHANLLIRLNLYNLSKILINYVDKYDYFIITRPDHLYKFPIFDKSFLNKDFIIKYNVHNFGGFNADFLIIPNHQVIDWLTSGYDFFTNDDLQDYMIEELKKLSPYLHISECFTNIIVKYKKYKIKEMSINSFISSDDINSSRSDIPFKWCDKRNVMWKHEEQFNETYKNFELWTKGHIWKYNDKNIYL